jgi:hypothetical protein
MLKVKHKAVPVHTTKAYIVCRGTTLLILTFTIDWGEWLTSCSSPFTPEKKKKKKVLTELEAG